jgi:hypothetical protein
MKRFFLILIENDRYKDTITNLKTDKPFEAEICQIIFNNSARTSKKTPNFTIIKINWLMLFKKIIAVYSKNRTKLIDTKYNVTDC